MLLGLHTATIMRTNAVTAIRVAKDTGYEAIELMASQLESFLDAGYRAEELSPELGSLPLTMINSFGAIENQEPDVRKERLERCRRLCAAAQELECRTLQVVALSDLAHLPWQEQCHKIAGSLAELAEIAAHYEVSLALEPVAFSPLNTINKALAVLAESGCSNVGLNPDTFHTWAAGEGWEVLAKLDPRKILAAHLSDATPCKSTSWSDMDRGVLPGDGIIPLKEAIRAFKKSGYHGVLSVELYSPYYWEWDPFRLAEEVRKKASVLLEKD